MKAFLSLEAGAVRGAVPDPGQKLRRALDRIQQQNQQIRQQNQRLRRLRVQLSKKGENGQLKQAQEQLKRSRAQLKRARESVSTYGQTIQMLRERAKVSRERQITDNLEIRRLQGLVAMLLEQQRMAQEQNGHRSEPASNLEADGGHGQAPSSGSAKALYLDLMKKSLKHAIYDQVQAEGEAWPSSAHTMIDFQSLDNLHSCVDSVLANGVPGDFIETGVWRGGASILMRAILEAHGVRDRRVWVADSFEGLPPPDPEKYPHDAGSMAHTAPQLAVSLEEVQANFQRYGLLDDQVRFLKGWFRDTLPEAPHLYSQ